MKDADSIAFTLYVTNWLSAHADISEISEKSISALYDKWKNVIVPNLTKPHRGECIDLEMKCARCEAEAYFENAAAIAKVLKDYNNDETKIETRKKTGTD